MIHMTNATRKLEPYQEDILQTSRVLDTAEQKTMEAALRRSGSRRGKASPKHFASMAEVRRYIYGKR